MSETRIPLENHGAYGSVVGLRVEGNDEHGVYLTVDPEDECPAETRTLTPGEARALAAVLVHYAAEAER